MTATPNPRMQLSPDVSRALLNGSRVLEYLRVSSDAMIVEVNPTLATNSRRSVEDLLGKSFLECLSEADRARARGWVAGSEPLPDSTVLLNFITPEHEVRSLRCLVLRDRDDLILLGEPDVAEDRFVAEELLRLNNELSVLARENARKTREVEAARKRLAEVLDELENSYWHLRKIQEHIPLCMKCGKISSGEGEWDSLVEYLQASDILVSHGYCASCADLVLDEEGL